ncbi:MAG TPA: glycosyltransferase [Mycobacteriales bacterium]
MTARHVAVAVPTLQRGGAERVALALAGEFARRTRVTVVTFDPRLGPRTLARAERLPWADDVPPGCEHVHLPATGSGVRRLCTLAARFARLARERRFDAVYTFLTYTNVLVALSRAAARSPYVHVASEHALAASLRSDGARLAVLARALPLAYRAPDRLVVVSDAVRHSLAAAGVLPRPERAVTIHNPIDLAAVRCLAGATVPPACPARGTVVVCVARLHAQKDHRTLLRALALLPPRYSLVLAGDGPLRAELERDAAGLGVAARTVFLGAVENPYPLLRRADVVALASVEEGFGLVALEAAAVGTPFAGSDVGGLAEACVLLGHPTFPVGNAASLAAVIDRLATRGRVPVPPERLARFELGRVARAYLDLASVPATREEAYR